jgi:hypothetical protein
MLPLQVFEPPLRLPASRIGMVWHDSLHDDPAQRWLRSTVAALCARLDHRASPTRHSLRAAPRPDAALYIRNTP